MLALCPGATQTEFWSSGAKPLFPMQPNGVVRIALQKLGRKTTVVAGRMNSISVLSTRLLPRSWNAAIFCWVIGKMLGPDARHTRRGRSDRPTDPACSGAAE